MKLSKTIRVLAIVFSLFVIIPVGTNILWGQIFFLNNSISAPRGIYLKWCSEIQINDYVIIESPIEIKEIGLDKGHKMLKKITGIPGNQYTVTDNELIIHSKKYPIKSVDYLPKLNRGIYKLCENYYLVNNDIDISLDSRYFGPISKDKILCKVKLVYRYKGD